MDILSSTLGFVLLSTLPTIYIIYVFPYLKAIPDLFFSLLFFDFQNLTLSYMQFQQQESERNPGAKPCITVGLYIVYCIHEVLVHAFDGLCPKGWMSAFISAFSHTFWRSLTYDPFLRLT